MTERYLVMITVPKAALAAFGYIDKDVDLEKDEKLTLHDTRQLIAFSPSDEFRDFPSKGITESCIFSPIVNGVTFPMEIVETVAMVSSDAQRIYESMAPSLVRVMYHPMR